VADETGAGAAAAGESPATAITICGPCIHCGMTSPVASPATSFLRPAQAYGL